MATNRNSLKQIKKQNRDLVKMLQILGQAHGLMGSPGGGKGTGKGSGSSGTGSGSVPRTQNKPVCSVCSNTKCALEHNDPAKTHCRLCKATLSKKPYQSGKPKETGKAEQAATSDAAAKASGKAAPGAAGAVGAGSVEASNMDTDTNPQQPAKPMSRHQKDLACLDAWAKQVGEDGKPIDSTMGDVTEEVPDSAELTVARQSLAALETVGDVFLIAQAKERVAKLVAAKPSPAVADVPVFDRSLMRRLDSAVIEKSQARLDALAKKAASLQSKVDALLLEKAQAVEEAAQEGRDQSALLAKITLVYKAFEGRDLTGATLEADAAAVEASTAAALASAQQAAVHATANAQSQMCQFINATAISMLADTSEKDANCIRPWMEKFLQNLTNGPGAATSTALKQTAPAGVSLPLAKKPALEGGVSTASSSAIVPA